MRPIEDVAADLGLKTNEIELYGPHIARLGATVMSRLAGQPRGRYVCVTSMSPTPAGEGKTTVAIGLAQAFARLGHRSVVTLRQASLGLTVGMKGGGSGGGAAQMVPGEDLNLGLTGDTAAVEAAHNLLGAFIDNHLYHGNLLGLDPRSITWRRVLDLGDRALRSIVTGLGGGRNGVPRETGFDITAASEVMGVLTLAGSLGDLRRRLGEIVVGWTQDGRPVTAEELHCAGAMAALLRHAIRPNLVQTVEGSPALVHGGAFANLGLGNSSVLADQLAIRLADVVITECGFGAELGLEKFGNIKCRVSGLRPSCAVVVATLRALRYHAAGLAGFRLTRENPDLLRLGIENLARQIENVRRFGLPAVVALNRFEGDSICDLDLVRGLALGAGASAVEIVDPWGRGGEGTEPLAHAVLRASAQPGDFHHSYDLSRPLLAKIEGIARDFYGAAGIHVEPAARRSLAKLEHAGYAGLPVCMAKTHLSLSHDPGLPGRPQGFIVPVTEARLAAGAGYILAVCGQVPGMPGLPATPAGTRIDVDAEGGVVGLA